MDPESRTNDLPIRPGPGLDPEAALRERMNEESPDGRPPSEPARRESRVVFWSILVLVTAVVIAALIWRGGLIPGVLALILMLAFVGIAAWPAWHAGLDRRIDERHVADELKAEHRGGGPAEHPT
jgi:hypothetical protein